MSVVVQNVGVAVSRSMKVMRFGNNMREVAVIEGDKAEVQIKRDWQVNTLATGDLVKEMSKATEAEIDAPAARTTPCSATMYPTSR